MRRRTSSIRSRASSSMCATKCATAVGTIAATATTVITDTTAPSMTATATAATTVTRTIAAIATTKAIQFDPVKALGRCSPGRLFLFGPAGYSALPAGAQIFGGRSAPDHDQEPLCNGHHAAHARLPAFTRAPGAGRRGLSVRRAGREVPRFRGGDRGQSARPRAPVSDQGDPGPGRDA